MATSKTLAPTNVTIQIPAMTDTPDASVFSNCVDKEADAINALNSKIAEYTFKAKTKISQSTDGTITFTFTGNRYTALLMKTDNMSGSSGVYAIIFKKDGVNAATKILGDTTLPTIDNDGSISIAVHAWSKVTLLTDMMDDFS